MGMSLDMEMLLDLGYPEAAYPLDEAHAPVSERMHAMSAALVEAACLILGRGARRHPGQPLQHDVDASRGGQM